MLLSYRYYERPAAPPPVIVVIKHKQQDSNDIKRVQFVKVVNGQFEDIADDDPLPGASVVVDLDFAAELDKLSKSEIEDKLKKLEKDGRNSPPRRPKKDSNPRYKKLKKFYKKHRSRLKVLWKTFSVTFVNFLYLALGYFFFIHLQKHAGKQSYHQTELESLASKISSYNNTQLATFIRIGELRCHLNKRPLTFWTSFDFCISIITTVGWGYIYPKTLLGKLFCILYASLGVPLYIVVIGANGQYISHVADKIDGCLKYKFMYLELAFKYIIIGILLGIFIFAHTQTAYSASRYGKNYDEHLNEWSWFESLYYSLISLTTIGFGDYFMPSASELHQVFNLIQAMAVLVSITFGFALFTYAFNAYAEASRRKMRRLRAKYEALATRNAALALAGIYANSGIMFERSQAFLSNNQNLRKMNTTLNELKGNTMESAQKFALKQILSRRRGAVDVGYIDPSILDNFEVQSLHSDSVSIPRISNSSVSASVSQPPSPYLNSSSDSTILQTVSNQSIESVIPSVVPRINIRSNNGLVVSVVFPSSSESSECSSDHEGEDRSPVKTEV